MDYFQFKFPKPQYLGSKYLHLSWINEFLPKNINKVCDAFGGSQSVAYFLKQKGYEVITNDFLNFNNQIGLSLIENKNITLNENDINILFENSTNKEKYTLVEDVFCDIFFERDECIFLDNFRSNVEKLNCPIKKSIAFSVINRSLTRKITMGHFAHTKALVYAKNKERVKRNKSLIKPLSDLFLETLPLYNSAIFDNGKNNRSFCTDIFELLPQIKDIDLIYIDPPYCDSHADYQGFYHFLETYVEYWRNKQFVNSTKRYNPKKISGFDKKTEILNSFDKLFSLSVDIPYWLISYNDRSYPNIKQLVDIISQYKNVTVNTKQYKKSRGGKGSVSGSNEILFFCEPKKSLYVV